MQKLILAILLTLFFNSLFAQKAAPCEQFIKSGDTTVCVEKFAKNKVKLAYWVQKQAVWCLIKYEYWQNLSKPNSVGAALAVDAPEFAHCDSIALRGDTLVFITESGKKYRKQTFYLYDKKLFSQQFYLNKDGAWGMQTRRTENPFSKLDGEQMMYHANGQLKAKGFFIDGKEDGKRLTFYENGQPQCDCDYKVGKRDGEQKVYWDNGQLKYHARYRDDKLLEIMAYFNKKGEPVEIGTFKNGTGTWVQYGENGEPQKIEIYENGILKTTKKVK
jgi:antitoxin component YwqK of YwqJK toxin-antitoxin module